MKVAIFGVGGQLGRAVAATLATTHDVVSIDHDRADVRHAVAVADVVRAAQPEWVLNCAAMTHVDRCENDPLAAFEVNALGARNVARAAAAAGARLLHVSTDYVFDGEKPSPYGEDDAVRPINAYGVSKLSGEWFVRADCPAHAIVRTSGLYGWYVCRGKGANFAETILARARQGQPLRVVSDERLTPTFTEDLAAQLRAIIEGNVPSGVYHATNAGACSWFDFASELVRLAGVPASIQPISAREWKSPTRRPANSVLENRALAKLGLDRMPDWRDALARYLAARDDKAGPAA
ncbi:MAG TPA: dTDP-4-dehydrorhamnose reductase [Candidatus Krumholzibacteria bacterium]|nr:dTDP-4-dehydrorhamnose reductase [Candidatus Krumholzibacteria bacterium]